MCIKKEFPKANQRLIEWAKWNREGGVARELELPSNSSYLNLPGGSFQSITGNENAEQVDILMSRIKKLWPESYECVRIYFVYETNLSDAATRSKFSRTTYDKYFQRGMGWLEGILK